MIHGFDLSSPLVCEGVIGDGCGGGRIFFVKEHALWAYDPLTQERMFLREGLDGVERIEKKGCIITLFYNEKMLQFDLSTLK